MSIGQDLKLKTRTNVALYRTALHYCTSYHSTTQQQSNANTDSTLINTKIHKHTNVHYTNAHHKMHTAKNIVTHRCTDEQMHRCTDDQMHKYTNAQIHKCTNELYRLRTHDLSCPCQLVVCGDNDGSATHTHTPTHKYTDTQTHART